MIKKLVAFDFDGTLSNSPEPEMGKEIWKDKTGQEYPHKGWWGRPESLDTDVFDIHMYDSVLNLLRKETADPETYVIILTSRMEKLRPQLEKILSDNQIVVDKVDMKRSERTKGEKILRYIQQFPDLEEIDVYDDRETDIISYKQIEERIPSTISFRIFLANNGQVKLMEAVNNLEGIIIEEIQKFKHLYL
jgi:hypothetical protein